MNMETKALERVIEFMKSFGGLYRMIAEDAEEELTALQELVKRVEADKDEKGS
jgi:hypothetical protein